MELVKAGICHHLGTVADLFPGQFPTIVSFSFSRNTSWKKVPLSKNASEKHLKQLRRELSKTDFGWLGWQQIDPSPCMLGIDRKLASRGFWIWRQNHQKGTWFSKNGCRMCENSHVIKSPAHLEAAPAWPPHANVHHTFWSTQISASQVKWGHAVVISIAAPRCAGALRDIMFFFLGSTLSMVPTQGPSTQLNREFRQFLVALSFFFFFFSFCQLTIHCRTLRLPVCASFKLLMKKNLTPQRHVFLRSSRYIRMANACLRRHAQIHEENRTCQFPYTLRSQGLCFRSISIKPLESTRSSSIGFSFSAFFLSPFKQKGHKSVIRNDTKSVTSKLEHVVYLLFWLQMESDCWSIADFLQ